MDNYKYDMEMLRQASKEAYRKNKDRIEQLEADSVALQDAVEDLVSLVAQLNARIQFLEENGAENRGSESYVEDADNTEEASEDDQNDTDRYEEMLRILGLSESATVQQIKTAYRRLSKKTHPDRGGDDEEFLRVQEAYEFLMSYAQAA